MLIKKLTAKELVKLNVTECKKEIKPLKSLAFFIPEGYGLNNTVRATGNHLGPNHEDVKKSALILSSSLLAAQGRDQFEINTLISPAAYSQTTLRQYGERLMEAAVGDPESSPIHMQSPAVVPYLLGGVPLTTVERLIPELMEALEMFPEEEPPTFSSSTKLLGFAPWQSHVHVDFGGRQTDRNVSHRQDFLLNEVRYGNWADRLLTEGAYNGTLRKRMTTLKADACEWVADLLDPRAGHMTDYAAQGRKKVDVTERDFAQAVQRVYERPWSELELTGGKTAASVTHDTQVLLARYIISRQAVVLAKMSAQTLVGISLLTGVPIAKFTEFAVYDLKRRGETFITADTIEKAIDILNMSAAGAVMGCESALREHAVVIRYEDGPAALRAKRLKSLKKPLWSADGTFYALDNKGKFKHKLENFNK